MSDNEHLIVDANPKIFERFVLSTVIHDRKFYLKFKSQLCPYDATLFTHRNDFSIIHFNHVYRVCAEYWDIVSHNESDFVPLYNWIFPRLGEKAAEEEFSFDEMNKILPDIQKLHSEFTESMRVLTNKSTAYWLSKKVAQRVIASFNAGIIRKNSTSDLIEELQAAQAGLLATQEDNSIISFEDALFKLNYDDQGNDSHPLFSGLNQLDNSVGNGFHRKQSSLIAAASGGGKTVLSTQLATNFVNTGRNTLIITTEQPPHELICRNISQACKMDFKHFVSSEQERIPVELFEHETYKKRYETFIERCKNHIKFLDWSSKMDMSSLQQLEPELDKMSDNGFIPDALIFDWIGGGIDKTCVTNPGELAMLMNRTAEFLTKVIAEKYNLHVFYTAQLDKEKSKNKRSLDYGMLQGSKQMPDFATNVILITNIRVKKNKAEDISNQDVYEKTQYFCVDKARKGPPKVIKVFREFQYQLFQEAPFAGKTLQTYR